MRSMKNSLLNKVILGHFDPKKSVRVYTDALDAHWAAVVT